MLNLKFIPIIVLALICSCNQRTGEVSKGGNVSSTVEETVRDSIVIMSSFLGKPLVAEESVYRQIAAIADQDDMLSYSDSILQIGEVRWRVNLNHGSIVLLTSVQPDDLRMKPVVNYLTNKYGKPYDDEDEGYDIKWSSSLEPDNVISGTLVHLRRIHSEEGGTVLIFH